MGIDAIEVTGTEDTLSTMMSDLPEDEFNEEGGATPQIYSSLSSYISERFQEFKWARANSGIETEIINSQRAFNNQYNPEDMARIKEEGGSEIFMSITNTKCRAIASWIRDILLNPNIDSFMVEPTPLQDLPGDLKAKIKEEIEKEVELKRQEKIQAAQEPQVGPDGQPMPPQPQTAMTAKEAEQTLRDMNQMRRDISDSVYEEIKREGLFQIKQIERLIKDQLMEGGWESALNDFITDFVIFPTAIMKGPIITKNKKLSWINGKVVTSDEFIFENKRVPPLDFYPSPSSTTISDGDTIEHVRYSRSDISEMRGNEYFNEEMIERVLANPTSEWYGDSGIEEDKAELEKRGTSSEMNKDVIHGLHFFGKISGEVLFDWGCKGISEGDQTEYEVEALMVGPEVIKCQINDDPLSRRPYYKASYCNIPGSFYGRSLPSLISDSQRVCNACARALANNMGLASGPQVELYVDRLADDGDITSITPGKIWQLTSDKTGGGGRAIQFFNVPSQANELLGVYKAFEEKADDASGLPKYAHGGQQATGAATTAQGLAMLLESASKSIKDAIRNIDYGLIIPRVEYQFYYNLIKNPDLEYTGDVTVHALGSSALTVKGSQQIRRNEFLMATANPNDMQVMGMEGRAAILRVMADDLGLGKNIIPDNLTLKRKEEEAQQQAQAAAQAAGSEKEIGLKATQLQIEGQMAMHQGTQAMRKAELDQKAQLADIASRIKILELESRREDNQASTANKTEGIRIKEANANARTKATLEAGGML